MVFGVPHSKFERRSWHRKFKLLKEFEALLKVVPLNEAQMKWVARTLDDFERKHPELKPQINRVLVKFHPIAE